MKQGKAITMANQLVEKLEGWIEEGLPNEYRDFENAIPDIFADLPWDREGLKHAARYILEVKVDFLKRLAAKFGIDLTSDFQNILEEECAWIPVSLEHIERKLMKVLHKWKKYSPQSYERLCFKHIDLERWCDIDREYACMCLNTLTTGLEGIAGIDERLKEVTEIVNQRIMQTRKEVTQV